VVWLILTSILLLIIVCRHCWLFQVIVVGAIVVTRLQFVPICDVSYILIDYSITLWNDRYCWPGIWRGDEHNIWYGIVMTAFVVTFILDDAVAHLSMALICFYFVAGDIYCRRSMISTLVAFGIGSGSTGSTLIDDSSDGDVRPQFVYWRNIHTFWLFVTYHLTQWVLCYCDIAVLTYVV